MHSTGYSSRANERFNGKIIVCQSLPQQFAHYYICLIQGALIQGQWDYEATPVGLDQIQD